jgi:2-dehydro-3-deoxyphosphogluconate aldolase / (4S)-4-hydroxy-2-oxoglutarate aldolase
MTPDELRTVLTEERLLAIVRGPDPAVLLDCLRVLVDAGVRLVEVSLTSAGAIGVLEAAARELGDVLVLGAGTVLTAQQVADVRSAGAHYVVTPAAGAGADAAYASATPVLVGALTPTEVWAAHEGGAAAVKLFPASLGGPAYLRALRDPLPDVPLVPVGGVDAEQVPTYLAAGAIAVGVGSPLLGDAVSGGDLLALAARARQFRAAAL